MFTNGGGIVKFVTHSWNWAHPLVPRSGRAPGVVWHHAAAKSLTPAALHRLHLRNGWAGIGYHFYVTKDGRVHRGRPLQFMGGHCLGHNDWVGVCAEGAYHVEKSMPPKQLRALQELHDWLEDKHGLTTHRKHGAMPGNSTACPGAFYPFKAVMAGVTKDEPEAAKVKLTNRSVTVRRRFKPHRPGWYSLGVVPFYERCKRQGDGKRWKITPDEVTLPEPVVKGWWWEEAEEAAAELKAEKAALKPTSVTRKRPPFWWLRYKP